MSDDFLRGLGKMAEGFGHELDGGFVSAIQNEEANLISQGLGKAEIDRALEQLGMTSIRESTGTVVDVSDLAIARNMIFGCPHAMGGCTCIAKRILGSDLDSLP